MQKLNCVITAAKGMTSAPKGDVQTEIFTALCVSPRKFSLMTSAMSASILAFAMVVAKGAEISFVGWHDVAANERVSATGLLKYILKASLTQSAS